MTPQLISKPEREPGPARHTIRIDVVDGRLVYSGPKGRDATHIEARRGDTIVWQSDHGNYGVLFKSKTPFSEVAYHAHRGMPTAEAKVIGINDKYHYAVTLIDKDGQPIVDDPVIIVNDGE